MVGIWIVVFRAVDLYRFRAGGANETAAIVKGCSIAALLTVLAGFLGHIEVSRLTVTLGYLFSIPVVFVGRIAARDLIRNIYSNPRIKIPLVVIGFNDLGRYLFDQVCDEMTPYEPVGFLDEDPQAHQYRGLPVLPGIARLAELASIHPCIEAAVAMPDASRERNEQVLHLCDEHRVRWWLVPWVFNIPPAGLRVDMMGVVPLLSLRGSNIEGLNLLFKRAFDVVIASILLIIAAPILLIGALAIWIEDGRPILFKQFRVGIHGQPFEFLKLRSMRTAARDDAHREYVRKWITQGDGAADAEHGGEKIFKLVKDDRITRVGRIIRRYRIDELPQLINVLRGDMSIIGPRPAVPYEIEQYQGWHRRRLDAAPGITGLWQVSGGNRLSFDDMVRLDVKYIEDWSFLSDLKILARTVPVLLRGEGL